jgi:IrrE N-terminal-like domain
VKRIADARGERIWYEAAEIEQITAAALRSAGLMPAAATKAIDIEAFVEMHLGVNVDYAGDLPDSVLGYTEFTHPPRIVVSRRLTELALNPQASLGLRGRWRATLAHEAAHVLLHSWLRSIGNATPKLTAQAISPTSNGKSSDWREVQANMGMAALLMPRRMFLAEARRLVELEGIFLPLDREALLATRLVAILGERFETSHEATRLRLLSLGWISSSDLSE